MGQLVMILRAKFLVDAQGYNKIQGKPFKQSEIEQKIDEMLEQYESARTVQPCSRAEAGGFSR